MAEKIINDRSAVEDCGTVIGEKGKPFPGLVTLAKKLHEASREAATLEAQAYEVGQIRATLLLNFGDTKHNRYGFSIGDSNDSTHALLMIVLEQLACGIGVGKGEVAPAESSSAASPAAKPEGK